MSSRRVVGKLLESVPLYSEYCAILLRQALKVAESAEETATSLLPKQTTIQSRYASSSDDDDDASSSSGASSEGAPSSRDEEQNNGDDDSSLMGHDNNNEPTNKLSATTTTNQSPKKSASILDQKHNAALIQKHVDSIPCTQLQLPTDESNNNVLVELPSCLLSKEVLVGGSAVAQCQSYQELSTALLLQQKPVIVLFVRSGRFAGAVFCQDQVLDHTTSTRYTVRRGQGKAQSAQDSSQRRPKSMGAQLRRQGEINLQQDVQTTLHHWQSHIASAALILISAPKTMKKIFFQNDSLLLKDDARIRRVPMDLGRPSFESVCLIYNVLTTVCLRERIVQQAEQPDEHNDEKPSESPVAELTSNNGDDGNVAGKATTEEKEEIIPLTALHWAAQNGDVEAIQLLLASDQCTAEQIDSVAGETRMTPLHYAAESSSTVMVLDPTVAAAACVTELLERGHVNPCIVDARNRVPYFLANHEKIRDAFRMARGNLGEDYCRWDDGAKVGPPLTNDLIEQKKEKEAEKKRKKRTRQKEKKAKEKAEAKRTEEQRLAEEQRRKEEEDAKRVRDGLKPKAAVGGVCDFCQKVCKGRQRAQMFKRLDYSYCSTECVQKHKRELMAAAATARFGS